ncbi:MAG: SOS response-associated peptidase [Rhodospirillales bacterium]|nr:SOS response-associated peptidase [Rhodospirillales bacterium]
MCGRFTQRMTWRELHERMDLVGTPLNLRPRFNVAPSQDVAAVRAADGGRTLAMLRWGLIPAWARDSAIGHRLINARSETAAQKPSFRAAYRQRRCLIPADGFYEWRREGKTRQPWLFGLLHGTPFAVAGLWERWTVPQAAALTGSLAERAPGDAVETCTILTTAANETVAPVHGRMPVILPPDAYGPWLAGDDVPLVPYPADAMTAHPVSTLVNRPANDDPRCVEPVAPA